MMENIPSNPLQCHGYQLNDQPWQGPTVPRPSQLRTRLSVTVAIRLNRARVAAIANSAASGVAGEAVPANT